MAFRQERYCVLNKSLRLDVGRICDYVSVNCRILQQEINTRLAVAMIRQIS